MNKVQHVKWCMKQTKLTSEISWPTDSCLAQLVRHWPEDPEVLVSNPTGGNFWRNFFCSPLYEHLSDNLTETAIVKNSIVPIWTVINTMVNRIIEMLSYNLMIDFKICLYLIKLLVANRGRVISSNSFVWNLFLFIFQALCEISENIPVPNLRQIRYSYLNYLIHVTQSEFLLRW